MHSDDAIELRKWIVFDRNHRAVMARVIDKDIHLAKPFASFLDDPLTIGF